METNLYCDAKQVSIVFRFSKEKKENDGFCQFQEFATLSSFLEREIFKGTKVVCSKSQKKNALTGSSSVIFQNSFIFISHSQNCCHSFTIMWKSLACYSTFKEIEMTLHINHHISLFIIVLLFYLLCVSKMLHIMQPPHFPIEKAGLLIQVFG